MFYSECKKCGKVRRWLDKQEVLDPKIVEENRHKPLTQKEYDAEDPKTMVLDIYCLEHAPKEKKTKKKAPVEE